MLPDALILLEDPVAPADGHVLVRQQGDRHAAQAALLPGPLAPIKVRRYYRVQGSYTAS